MIFYNRRIFNSLRDLPLIMYASSGGGGGVNTNAYKYVQGGRGGSGLLKNATISEPQENDWHYFQSRSMPYLP